MIVPALAYLRIRGMSLELAPPSFRATGANLDVLRTWMQERKDEVIAALKSEILTGVPFENTACFALCVHLERVLDRLDSQPALQRSAQQMVQEIEDVGFEQGEDAAKAKGRDLWPTIYQAITELGSPSLEGSELQFAARRMLMKPKNVSVLD